MTHVDWPVHGQRNLAEHSPVIPHVAAALPKNRMLDPVLFAPYPVGARPKRAVAISTVLHEMHELTIGNVLILHTERGYPNRQSSTLVIPSKTLAVGRQPKCRRTFWNFDQVI